MSLIFKGKIGTKGTLKGKMVPILPPDWNNLIEDKVFASDAQSGAEFGGSAALSGDGNTAIFGARLDDEVASNAGAAYIFTRSGSTWTEQQKILGPATNTQFGNSVSISNDGNTAIVGCQYAPGGGAVYVYTRNGSTWTETQVVQPVSIAAGDLFGVSVSIAGDGQTFVAGSSNDDPRGNASGSATVFIRSGEVWSEEVNIWPNDSAASDQFGYSVSMSDDGNTFVGGSFGDADNGSSTGSATIFVRTGTTWTKQQKIKATIPASGTYFGRYTGISGDGDTIVVGAYGYGSNQGAAYVYTRAEEVWSDGEFFTKTGTINAQFGNSVTVSSNGNIMVVAQWRGATNAGKIFIYTKTDGIWDNGLEVLASDSESNDRFGTVVSISSDAKTIISSAVLDAGTGSGYVLMV